MSRGMRSENPKPDDELQIRCFWRAWERYMSSGDGNAAVSYAIAEEQKG